jgi:hypothetical protein
LVIPSGYPEAVVKKISFLPVLLMLSIYFCTSVSPKFKGFHNLFVKLGFSDFDGLPTIDSS